MNVKFAQNLSHEVCGVIIKLWNKDARAVSVHVRHAFVEVQRRHWCSALWSACWCTRRSSFTCDAVALIHFILIAVYRSHCFHRSHFT